MTTRKSPEFDKIKSYLNESKNFKLPSIGAITKLIPLLKDIEETVKFESKIDKRKTFNILANISQLFHCVQHEYSCIASFGKTEYLSIFSMEFTHIPTSLVHSLIDEIKKVKKLTSRDLKKYYHQTLLKAFDQQLTEANSNSFFIFSVIHIVYKYYIDFEHKVIEKDISSELTILCSFDNSNKTV